MSTSDSDECPAAPLEQCNPGQQASDHLAITCISRRPRAVAVLLGWIGAEVAQIQQYTQIYHNLKCSTVTATAPILALAVNDTTTIGELAITLCREAARLIRIAELSEMGFGKIPILVHVFGNGGAQVLEELERRIREVVSSESLQGMKDQTHSFSSSHKLTSSRSIRKLNSSRSLLSTATTNPESDDDEDESMTHAKPGILLLPNSDLPLSRPSTFSFAKYSLNNCGFQPQKRDSQTPSRRRRRRRKKRAPAVNRVDMERTALTSTSTSPKYNSDDRAFQRDLELFASHLAFGTILWDSAPCYPTLEAELAAAGKSIANWAVRGLACSAITSAYGWHGMWYWSFLGKYPLTDTGTPTSGGRTEQFWKNMEHMSLTKKHAFVYSTADSTLDPQKVQELIALQKMNGIQVMELSLENDGGLPRQRHQLEKYSDFLDDVLDDIVARKLGEENEDDWWSSEDEEAGQEVVEQGTKVEELVA